jgi:hypothetical protein
VEGEVPAKSGGKQCGTAHIERGRTVTWRLQIHHVRWWTPTGKRSNGTEGGEGDGRCLVSVSSRLDEGGEVGECLAALNRSKEEKGGNGGDWLVHNVKQSLGGGWSG